MAAEATVPLPGQVVARQTDGPGGSHNQTAGRDHVPALGVLGEMA